MRTFESPDALKSVIAEPMGPSDWVVVSQDMINKFADATGDRQWIHVDVERARREAPGGTTIAHGYLLLSLMGVMQPTIYSVRASRTLNYGVNKLRFLSPVPAGSRICLTETIKSAEQVSGGLRVTAEITVAIEGGERPALVAEIVFLYFP